MSGQIVGAILFNGVAPVESGKMLNVMFTSRPSARWLAESKIPTNMTIVEVLLVRRTLAWITGIILIIATLLGVSFSYILRRKMGNKNDHSGHGPFCLSCFDFTWVNKIAKLRMKIIILILLETSSLTCQM